MKKNCRSYETRLHVVKSKEEALCEYALLFSEVQHSLFKATILGMDPNTCKATFLSAFGITARQYNACKAILEGKIASIKERRDALIITLKNKIETIQSKTKKIRQPFVLHQKKRQLAQLVSQFKKLKEDKKKDTTRLCFGSKKLFHAQFALEKNGLSNHEEWRKKWKETRCNEFFVLGSKDETCGNQSCTASRNPDGSLHLRLRLPHCLEEKYGKYIEFSNVYFKYGHNEIINALLECEKRRELKDPNLGQALSYRFKKDEKGWRVFLSLAVPHAPLVTDSKLGMVGVDINNDHLAIVETDRFGNPINQQTIPLILYGKTSYQAKALIGDACKQVVQLAKQTNKPIALEELDFQKKKSSLKEKKSRYARMLSSFAYHSILTHIQSGSSKIGIEVKKVNPAYTSVIGRVKFSKRYGLSIHHAAALTIARRSLRFSEKPSSSQSIIPDGRGGHVALPLPVRNRGEHVWSFWKKVSKKVSVELAAHFRSMRNRSTNPCKTAREKLKASEVAGGIPAHESSELLFC